MTGPIVMTIGEPAGIGPDIAIALWARRAELDVPSFVLLADPNHLRRRAAHLGCEIAIGDDPNEFDAALPVLALHASLEAEPGRPATEDASGVVEAIDRAVAALRDGKARAMVTLPINKASLYATGFSYPGHTEYLAHLAQDRWQLDAEPLAVMMIASPLLRTVPVTIHIPLADVAGCLTIDAIRDTVHIVHRDLRSRFGIEHPRIAIAGLNPHAGEAGTIGMEDETIVRPAIAALQTEGLDVVGPLPADTMFHPAARAGYDAAVCMYHDQALVPAKTLAFDEGVNVTLGLPFIRTSPDHGTAFDIAGTGRARIDSTLAALRMAHDLAARSKADRT